MMNIFQAIIIVFIEVSCCYIFFGTFLRLRFPQKVWMNRSLLLFLTALLTVVALLFSGQNVLKAIVVIFLIATVMFGLYGGKVRNVIFFTLCFYGVALLLDAGFIGILRLISPEQYYQAFNNPTTGMLLVASCKALLFLGVVIVRWKFSNSRPYDLPESKEWLLFLFTPVMTVAMLLLLFIGGGGEGRVVLIVTMGLLPTNLVLFYLLQNFVLRSREHQELRLQEERIKSQLELYRSREDSYKKLRAREHEFKNQIGSIHGMLMEGSFAEAMKYSEGINHKMDSSNNLYDTSHLVINTILNQKHQQAKSKGITIIYLLDMLTDISIEDDDLVILLSNLLNNALEACEKIEEKKKIIHFRMQIEENSVVIATKNPIAGFLKKTEGKALASTKDNPEQHGMGIMNIEQVVRKYNGDSEYSCSEGFFYYTIIFKKEDVLRRLS